MASEQVRDWSHDWSAGSFRGVPFWCDKISRDGGRRLVVHQFPLRDTPYVEDLGADAKKLTVTVYVASEGADGEATALEQACNDRFGPGQLDLPFFSGLAHCDKCKRDEDKDKRGYVAFSITFVKDGSGAAPFPIPYVAELVHVASGAIAAPMSGLLSGLFRGVGVPSYILEQASSHIRDLAAVIDVALDAVSLASDAAPAIRRALAAISADAPTLAAMGPLTGRVEPLAHTLSGADAGATPLVTRLDSVLTDIRAALPPEQAASLFAGLAEYTLPEPGFVRRSAWAVVDDRNRGLLDLALGALVTAHHAAASADTTFTDRRSAIAARAKAATVSAVAIERASAFQHRALYTALTDLTGRTSELLSRSVADLVPVIVIEARYTMPSLWWANRLYQDATRAGELVARNRVHHPGFMPTRFEAVAA